MRTFGLGGDSEISMAETGLTPKLFLGPRRVIPLCQAASAFPEVITPILNAQADATHLPRFAGRFVQLSTTKTDILEGLNARARNILSRISIKPQPVEISSRPMQNAQH